MELRAEWLSVCELLRGRSGGSASGEQPGTSTEKQRKAGSGQVEPYKDPLQPPLVGTLILPKQLIRLSRTVTVITFHILEILNPKP